MNKQFWLGVDLGKDNCEIAVAPLDAKPESWASFSYQAFENSASGIDDMLSWLSRKGIALDQIVGVCMEATACLAWTWSAHLDGRLGPVSIVNPARPVAFSRSLGIRDKTDRIDACVLALYGVAMRPKARSLPSKLTHQLRELDNLYTSNRREHQANKNRLDDPLTSKKVRCMLNKRVKFFANEMVQIEKEMDRLIDQDDTLRKDAKRIITIPGVGEKTVRAILAMFGDLRQYKRNEIVSLAGLYPKKYESGKSVHRKSRMAKGGGARIRACLFMVTLTARRTCPPLKAMADRMEARGVHNMVIRGALMRKLILMIRAIVISETTFCADFGNEVKSNAA